jgi:hypothetical protein
VPDFAPASGDVSSATSLTTSRTFATAASKTVKVMAQDQGALSSAWSTLTLTCTEPPPPPQISPPPPSTQCSDIVDNDGDGMIDLVDPDCTIAQTLVNSCRKYPPREVKPSLVRKGNTTRVYWSSQDIASCSVTSTNSDAWSTLVSPVTGEISSPITGKTTYTLTCVDGNGATHTKKASVHIPPTFREI